MIDQQNGVKVSIDMSDSIEQVIEKATLVRPSKRQIDWQGLELTAFMHFGMNTFYDCEWGDGTADPSDFKLDSVDAKQWVRILKEAGFNGMILTCKHHDGFCLWPSAYTEYSVKNSPYKDGKGDIVKEVSDACREAGMKFGVYLSPWDRHDERYGDSPAYNRYFMDQLTELLTNYGDIFEVWFDGACAEGPNGKRQEYAWDEYYSHIRSLQPEAVISISGPDVRWVGNEAGKGRKIEWSVIPGCSTGEFARPCIDCTKQDLASNEALANRHESANCLYWSPAQVDTSIRPGWFYHSWEDKKVKSLYHLVEIYDNSIGANAQLLLNIPPDLTGRINEHDEKRLLEFGKYIKEAYMQDSIAEFELPSKENGYVGHFRFDKPTSCNCVILSENIAEGQRVCSFVIKAVVNGETVVLEQGATIGYKKIVKFENIVADEIIVEIDNYRAEPLVSFGGVYSTPDVILPPQINRDAEGLVNIVFGRGADAFYSVDDGEVLPYTGPFALTHSGKVTAIAEYGEKGINTMAVERQFGALRNKWTLVSPDHVADQFDPYYQGKRSCVMFFQFPCSMVIDLGETHHAAGIIYNPVPGAMDFLYNVFEIELSGSMDGENFTTLYSGRLDNIKNNPIEQQINFKEAMDCRYFKFTAISGFDAKVAAIGSFEIITY